MIAWCDRISLIAVGVGIALMLLPGWGGALPLGFWLTIIATIAQIIFSHLPRGDDS